jgi:hypothetical protein
VTSMHLIRHRDRLESKTGHLAVPYRLRRYVVCCTGENRQERGRYAQSLSGIG